MLMPTGDSANELDIEVIVPSEYEDSYHGNRSTNQPSLQDPDQPLYSHYRESNANLQGASGASHMIHTMHSYGCHASRRRVDQQRAALSDDDELIDLGFIDIDDSDGEDRWPTSGRSGPTSDRRPRTAAPLSGRGHSKRSLGQHGTLGDTRGERAVNRYKWNGKDTRNVWESSSDGEQAKSSGDQREKNRRMVHRPPVFVKARYPAKFHSRTPGQKAADNRARTAALRLPSTFCPRTPYGQEAVLVGERSKRSTLKQWPTPPIYPPKPKVNDIAVDCHILRLVKTTDTGTQNVPATRSKASQMGNPRKETATQYPKVRRKEVALDPIEVKSQGQAVQCTPLTRNASVETAVSIMFYPNVVITEDRGTQASGPGNSPQRALHSISPPEKNTKLNKQESTTQHRQLVGEDQPTQAIKAEGEKIDYAARVEQDSQQKRTPPVDSSPRDELYKDDFESESDDEPSPVAVENDDMLTQVGSPRLLQVPDISTPPDLVGDTPRELVGFPDSCSEEEEEEEERNQNKKERQANESSVEVNLGY